MFASPPHFDCEPPNLAFVVRHEFLDHGLAHQRGLVAHFLPPADGHGAGDSNRIVKLTADGTFINAYGAYGIDPGQLRVPMDVTVMSNDTAIVTAGDGDRVEIFTTP